MKSTMSLLVVCALGTWGACDSGGMGPPQNNNSNLSNSNLNYGEECTETYECESYNAPPVACCHGYCFHIGDCNVIDDQCQVTPIRENQPCCSIWEDYPPDGVCCNGVCTIAPICPGTGPSCTSTSCGPLETCWNQTLCVAHQVPIPDGAGGIYHIDSTEVTNKQYREWLGTNPSLSDLPWACDFKQAFTTASLQFDEEPAVVDWCDAYAYCAGVGKRLCGQIGYGLPNDFNEYANAALSQWYRACSSGGAHAYPYGDTEEPTTCNGTDNPESGCDAGSCDLVEVGTLTGCTPTATGYGGIYDLSGNVAEWEDSCNGNTDGADICHIRGGSYIDFVSNLRCDSVYQGGYNRRDSLWAGIRCCSDN